MILSAKLERNVFVTQLTTPLAEEKPLPLNDRGPCRQLLCGMAAMMPGTLALPGHSPGPSATFCCPAHMQYCWLKTTAKGATKNNLEERFLFCSTKSHTSSPKCRRLAMFSMQTYIFQHSSLVMNLFTVILFPAESASPARCQRDEWPTGKSDLHFHH